MESWGGGGDSAGSGSACWVLCRCELRKDHGNSSILMGSFKDSVKGFFMAVMAS